MNPITLEVRFERKTCFLTVHLVSDSPVWSRSHIVMHGEAFPQWLRKLVRKLGPVIFPNLIFKTMQNLKPKKKLVPEESTMI